VVLGLGAAAALPVVAIAAIVLSLLPAWHDYARSAAAPLASGAVVRVDADRIAVRVVNGGDGQVSAALTGRYSTRVPGLAVSQVSGTDAATEVAISCPEEQCEGTVTVTVPSSAPVDVTTSLGAITVDGLPNDLRLGSQMGAVSVANTTGIMRLASGTGPLTVTGADADQASLQSTGGTITASFASQPDIVAARSTTGAIDLTLPGGPYTVAGEGTARNTDVTVPTSPDAGSVVVFSSTSGAVTVGAAS
jgi:hypothetical protein